VVGFVVEYDDVLQAHEIGHHALDHLAFGFERVELLADATLEQLPTPFGEFEFFAAFERVEIGDDDLCACDIIEHIVGDDFSRFVVAVRIVGLQHAKSIADRQAWGDDQEPARVGFACWTSDGIDGLPCDEHRHDRGFAGACGEFER